MTGFDNTPAAQANRERKARAIATRLRVDGADLSIASALPEKDRRALERRAGVPSSSGRTWDRALELLAARPPVRVDRRPPGCDCTPDERGVLYEAPGWPCPHEHPAYADAFPLADGMPGVVVDPELPDDVFALVSTNPAGEVIDMVSVDLSPPAPDDWIDA